MALLDFTGNSNAQLPNSGGKISTKQDLEAFTQNLFGSGSGDPFQAIGQAGKDVVSAGERFYGSVEEFFTRKEEKKLQADANQIQLDMLKEQKLQADLSNMRERRQIARDTVAAQANVRAQGALEGGVITSAQEGALSAIVQQGGQAVSYLDQVGASQGRQLAFNMSLVGINARLQTLQNQRQDIMTGINLVSTGYSMKKKLWG